MKVIQVHLLNFFCLLLFLGSPLNSAFASEQQYKHPYQAYLKKVQGPRPSTKETRDSIGKGPNQQYPRDYDQPGQNLRQSPSDFDALLIMLSGMAYEMFEGSCPHGCQP